MSRRGGDPSPEHLAWVAQRAVDKAFAERVAVRIATRAMLDGHEKRLAEQLSRESCPTCGGDGTNGSNGSVTWCPLCGGIGMVERG